MANSTGHRFRTLSSHESLKVRTNGSQPPWINSRPSSAVGVIVAAFLAKGQSPPPVLSSTYLGGVLWWVEYGKILNFVNLAEVDRIVVRYAVNWVHVRVMLPRQ